MQRRKLAEQMLAYFREASGEGGLPSFTKFAQARGMTTEQLLRLRSYGRFLAAYNECRQMLFDRLVDGALTKRFDPAFVRYLIGYLYEQEGKEPPQDLQVTVRVLDEEPAPADAQGTMPA